MGLQDLEWRFERSYNVHGLPKWTQEYIEALKREVRKQTDAVEAIEGSMPKTSVYYRVSPVGGDPVYLPEHVEVVFDFGSRSRIRVHKNAQSGRIDVSGDGRVEVRPVAANWISVEPV